MTKEEFIAKMQEDSEWAPGWELIDREFARLYPGQEPTHYATNMISRAIFGGDAYLDGYSVYHSPKGYKHIVTYGMTELYANEEAFGGEWNKWGYEMTMKLKEKSPEDCRWAIDIFSNLARYTYTEKNFFEPLQYIAGNGTSLHTGTESAITALITVADTEAITQDSVYGRTDFIQLVGITEQEFQAIKGGTESIELLIQRMKEDNPDLVTDMGRKKSYLTGKYVQMVHLNDTDLKE